jgi:prevent-host-death family protein
MRTVRKYSIAKLKATLAERIREVERGYPIVLTRHGKDVAALVPHEDLRKLERLRAAGPKTGLASLAGGWEGSDELAQLLEQSERHGRRESP